MNLRGHAVRHSPVGERLRIEKKLIDSRTRSADVKINAS
jgi:hypothetical protein